MTATFARARGGRVKVRLGDADRGVVAGLLEAVAGMLEPPSPSPPPTGAAEPQPSQEQALFAQFEAQLSVEPPADPAVARLLPDASRDDHEVAQCFRRLTELDLLERKRGALALAATALRRPAPVVLDDSEAQALLKGLTDVRLVLAQRLGIETDEDAEFLHAALAAGARGGPQEWAKAAELYEVVTYLQEELVHTLLPS